ncbi:dihydrofolate reductase [Candidatus Microgenomates bacterium]|nr:dihydrofolate reductase [Candidatus Microgenomates bacterium]
MHKPKISIIAAIGSNRELGLKNKLLWHIPEDMERFKQITLGHPVIMGRTTYESIGKPLLGRTNIIVTRDNNYKAVGCLIAHSLEEAIEIAKEMPAVAKAMAGKKIFIIGGGQIYGQGIKYADKLYLTIVKGKFEADTYFPDYSQFKKIIFQKEGKDKNYGYTFLELER